MDDFKWTEKGTINFANRQYFIGAKLPPEVQLEITQLAQNAYAAGQREKARELRRALGVKP